MRNSRHGFTLIELLIVVAIIAILAGIAVPNFLEAQTRAKIGRVKADMRSIATGLEAYVVDWNHYPYERFADRFPVTLTTPIAYLSSLPLDTFRISSPEQVDVPNNERTYYYFRFLSPEEESRPNVAEWRGSDADYESDAETINRFGRWGLSSYGPDLKLDKVWGGLIFNDPITRIYDATNGTASTGDIVRTQSQQQTNTN